MAQSIPAPQDWQTEQALLRYQMIAPLLDETIDEAKRCMLREEACLDR